MKKLILILILINSFTFTHETNDFIQQKSDRKKKHQVKKYWWTSYLKWGSFFSLSAIATCSCGESAITQWEYLKKFNYKMHQPPGVATNYQKYFPRIQKARKMFLLHVVAALISFTHLLYSEVKLVDKVVSWWKKRD